MRLYIGDIVVSIMKLLHPIYVYYRTTLYYWHFQQKYRIIINVYTFSNVMTRITSLDRTQKSTNKKDGKELRYTPCSTKQKDQTSMTSSRI